MQTRGCQGGVYRCATGWLPHRPALPPERTVETGCFTLGIRGIYAEARRAASLAAPGASVPGPPAGVVSLRVMMVTHVPMCLTELNDLYLTRSDSKTGFFSRNTGISREQFGMARDNS